MFNRPTISAFALFVLLPLGAVQAATFSVGPVRVSMNSESPTATIEVRSGDFMNPILLQATAYTWTQKDGERVLEPDTDLQVSPSVLKLEPGDVRTLLLSSNAELDSPRYYRLRIEEIGAETNKPDANQLAFLKAFDIPVFVEPPGARAALDTTAVQQDDGSVKVVLTNHGNAQVAATSFRVAADADRATARRMAQLVYVLPGSQRVVEIPAAAGEAAGSDEAGTPARVLSDSDGLFLFIEGTTAGQTIASVPIVRSGRGLIAND